MDVNLVSDTVHRSASVSSGNVGTYFTGLWENPHFIRIDYVIKWRCCIRSHKN